MRRMHLTPQLGDPRHIQAGEVEQNHALRVGHGLAECFDFFFLGASTDRHLTLYPHTTWHRRCEPDLWKATG